MISSYISQDTFIHRLKPGIKLSLLILCGTTIFMVSSISTFLFFLLSISLLYRIAKIPFNKIIKQFKSVWLFLIFIFIFQAIFDNWLTGLSLILRLILLISLASLISFTTKASDMITSIEVGFRFFSCLGVNSSKLSIALSMAIRFIPVISEKFNEICEAQRARGLNINIIALAIPLTIRTIRIASEVAEALDARSYEHDDNQLYLKE
ncbi:energy-coupling factor transporter transmembrane protein EcfT [Bartonella sp. AR 15-3]|uniref:energy-coupling factor transporter transmembrane component T family protein n=1 Tax=Bartonella sp. AR 15-3 TaxID=545617 RepID=UPI00099A9845|nr:energy-coupling factor transporter transmembrane protein EcfT [Bartonella sp. AR 15-3]OPB31154.1 biotin transport system permease protein [Bartonella sp. AR 15-3]